MQFRYKKFSKKVLRPIIPITLQANEKTVRYEVLIDSGADICIIDAEIGELLGLDIERGEPHPVSGIVDGQRAFYYNHQVTALIGGWPYQMTMGFSRHISKTGYGIVGQNEFFEKFRIIFDLRKETIELKEARL